MDDCIAFTDKREPYLTKVHPLDLSFTVVSEITGLTENFSLYVFMKVGRTASPQCFLYAGLGAEDPFISWDVSNYVDKLQSKPLGNT